MTVVVGHVSQIMTRYLSLDVLTARYWGSYIHLGEESRQQLAFWNQNLEALNRKNLYESHKCSKIVFSDANAIGYAGYAVSTIYGIIHGFCQKWYLYNLPHGGS